MRRLDTQESVRRLDGDCLGLLRSMRRAGKTSARAGEVARRLSCNSVQALGAMERVKESLWSQ